MLTQRVDLFDSTYGHFTEDVLAATRRETFGQDIGQNSPIDCVCSRNGGASYAPADALCSPTRW